MKMCLKLSEKMSELTKSRKTGCDLYAVTYNCYIAGFIYYWKKPFRSLYN